MELDEFDLACLDATKVLFIDLEADVCMENKVYTHVINSFATLTNNVFLILKKLKRIGVEKKD